LHFGTPLGGNSISLGGGPRVRFVFSFYYSSDVMTEISRFFKQTQRVIVPLTVREILDEQIAHKLA
jgi:hypothetical protein